MSGDALELKMYDSMINASNETKLTSDFTSARAKCSWAKACERLQRLNHED